MSALLREPPRLLAMTVAELPAVASIEAAAYDFPWTRGNFVDSLAAGYLARVLCDADDRVVGYFVAMKGVEEVHLLNLTVAPPEQGRGHARLMLDELVAACAQMHARQLWLEVRESNSRARGLYTRYGFRHIGVRRGYYPALHGRREDAAVMALEIKGARDVE
jgi:ribosomal-protein-alanine N-acetyltransferase